MQQSFRRAAILYHKKIAALQKQSLGVQQFFYVIKLLHGKKEGPFATENSVYLFM